MVEHLAYTERVSGSTPLLLSFIKFMFSVSLFYLEFAKVGILLIFAVILSFIIMGISFLISTSLPDTEKVSAYECGFDPYEDARNVFDVRFYLVAIMFLIFDLEALFFFPWCVSLSFLHIEGYWAMTDFVVELLAGYVYAWQVGALDWE